MNTKSSGAAAWWFIIGGAFVFFWVVSKMSTSPSENASPSNFSAITIPLPTVTPTPTPEAETTLSSLNYATSTGISLDADADPTPTPTPFSPAELKRIHEFVPPEIRLTKSETFPIMSAIDPSRVIGENELPVNLRLKVIELQGEEILVEFHGRQKSIPLTSTDFLERRAAEASQ